jgi:hypothetical protein
MLLFRRMIKKIVMEQQLINAFMKLVAKAGGGSLMKDMIQKVDESGNPKIWTPSEIDAALKYITWQIENFGAAEATAVIETLIRKYNLRPESFLSKKPVIETSGVAGLQ